MTLDPRALGLVGQEIADGGSHLADRLVRAIGLEDPRLRLHYLREPPERRPLAVRERAALAPDDEFRVVVDDAEELADETRLADPGDPDDGDELRLEPCPCTGEPPDEDLELVVPSDERRPDVGEVDPKARSAPDRAPR